MMCSNRTVCTYPPPSLGTPFQPPYGADIKINVRFEFGTPKNIVIDTRRVSIKQFALYFHFGPPFHPPYGADVKIIVRFEFGIAENTEIHV